MLTICSHQESVFDKPCSGIPAISVSDENIETVRKLLTKDHVLLMNCRLTVNLYSKSLPEFNDEKNMLLLCADNQKQARLQASQDFVETPNILNCIVTEDES